MAELQTRLNVCNGPILHNEQSGFPPISDEKFTPKMRVVDPLQT